MRSLFTLDLKNYDLAEQHFIRPSVRGIIIQNNKICMVHSLKYDYYKFPGGGIEPGETHVDTLVREVREEAGLSVIPDSIREYGSVHRIQRHTPNGVFIQDNFYYLCRVHEQALPQHLDPYEAEEQFTMEFTDAQTVIRVNRERFHGSVDQTMLEREARVIEYLLFENYLH